MEFCYINSVLIIQAIDSGLEIAYHLTVLYLMEGDPISLQPLCLNSGYFLSILAFFSPLLPSCHYTERP